MLVIIDTEEGAVVRTVPQALLAMAAGAPGGGRACGPCQQLVTQTVMVPQVVWKTQTVPVTVFRPETRQKTITVWREVPEQQEVRHTVTEMVPRTPHSHRDLHRLSSRLA